MTDLINIDYFINVKEKSHLIKVFPQYKYLLLNKKNKNYHLSLIINKIVKQSLNYAE